MELSSRQDWLLGLMELTLSQGNSTVSLLGGIPMARRVLSALFRHSNLCQEHSRDSSLKVLLPFSLFGITTLLSCGQLLMLRSSLVSTKNSSSMHSMTLSTVKTLQLLALFSIHSFQELSRITLLRNHLLLSRSIQVDSLSLLNSSTQTNTLEIELPLLEMPLIDFILSPGRDLTLVSLMLPTLPIT